MQAARAERAYDAHPRLVGSGRRGARGSSRSLQVQKTDSIRWRIGARCGPLLRRRAPGGRWSRPAWPLGGEVAARIAFVADDSVSPPVSARGRSRVKRHLALRPVGGSQGGGPWGAVGGAEQMQAAAPEPARMAAGVAVAADLRERRAPGGLAERPHSTGVESRSSRSSSAPGALSSEDARQPLDRLGKPARRLW